MATKKRNQYAAQGQVYAEAKKELTAADFTVTVSDGDRAVVMLDDAALVASRADLRRLINRLAAAATVIR